MNALVLSLGLLMGSGADDLVPYLVKHIHVSVPAAWYHNKSTYWPGVWVANGSDRWTAPSLDAYFTVDVDTVKRKEMTGQECRDKIIDNLGRRGFSLLRIGGQPAAKRIEMDYGDHAELFVSHTYVGCDGHFTWAVSFHFVEKRRARFEGLADRVAASVRYQPPVE